MKNPSFWKPLAVFFALAYLFTWVHWLPQAAIDRGIIDIALPEFLEYLGGYGPALAAIITAAIFNGREGLRTLFASLIRWRVSWKWYLAALLISPAIQITATAVYLFLSGQPFVIDGSGPSQLGMEGIPIWGIFLILSVIFILGFDGIGEELGWRGFALPRLQKNNSALKSSLVLGFFWASWHLAYMLSASSALQNRPFILFLLNVMGISIVYTWIYNNTGGSTLLAILFHATGNITGTLLAAFIPATSDPAFYLIGTILNWLAATIVIITQPGIEKKRIPGEPAPDLRA